MMQDHIPQGNPCLMCGESAFKHRVEHKPQGDPCSLCGLPASRHRYRKRAQFTKQEPIYLGVDGEGQGRKKHLYVTLSCSTETGSRAWWIHDPEGLSTKRCLDFLLELPQSNSKMFCYSFGYDLTKILTDLPDDKLYVLFRPELRQRPGKEALKGPYPVRWEGYSLNMQGTKFTIIKGDRRRVVWDIWKFFQGKFVGAIENWKVGNPELWERMQRMKDRRADFDKLTFEEVLDYNLEECRCMAGLARKLVEAHEKAELELTSFYGAGSTASAMLKKMGIKDKIKPAPKDMSVAVASAFFGGRFENSAIGVIEGRVFNYDISSAYPYQLCFLPCLLHGTWEHTFDRKALEDCQGALVHYTLGPNPRISSWGPFPFRTSEGAICFPITSGGGWVWKQEYEQAERMFPHVQFQEAWVYRTICACQPFKDIPRYYLERLKIGKEGAGIVIKLGMNSNYGKLAQSVGRGVFNSWVWAGMITSNTRAQLLAILERHKDWSNLLMMATDGIYTREEVETPLPWDTGTDVEVLDTSSGKTVRKPLGAWEKDVVDKGIFLARPGIYFPLNPTDKELKKIRGRGVGKGVVYENHARIVDSWNRYGVYKSVKVANVSRFCGAKSSISRSGPPNAPVYKRADGTQKMPDGRPAPAYGQWVTREVEMSFDPMPKRAAVNPDGVTLQIREIHPSQTSHPYRKALRSVENIELSAAREEAMEQPDADLTDYEAEDV